MIVHCCCCLDVHRDPPYCEVDRCRPILGRCSSTSRPTITATHYKGTEDLFILGNLDLSKLVIEPCHESKIVHCCLDVHRDPPAVELTGVGLLPVLLVSTTFNRGDHPIAGLYY